MKPWEGIEVSASPEAPADLTPLDTLRVLYAGAVATGVVEFRLIGKGKPTQSVFMPWPTFPESKDVFTLAQVPAGYSPYYGLSLRQDASSGKAENCKVTRLLWADFDLKGTPYLDGQSNVLELEPEELRAAAQALQGNVLACCEALGLPPRLAVYTGHGLQVVWAREYGTSPEDTERLNRALVAEFGEEMGADRKTVDVARVFRVPGSFNLKNPARPLPVEVWHADPGAVVDEKALADMAQRHAPRPPAPALKPAKAAPSTGQADVIREWNARNPIREALERYGYRREGDKVYTRPGEGASGGDVKLLENKRGVLCSFHHSSNDPLDGGNGDGHLREPFDLYAEYEHGGDMKAAVKAAAEELGMEYAQGEGIRVGSSKPAPAEELTWGEREALPPILPPAPAMPPEMLPAVLRGWLVDVAELACVSLEGVAAPAVVGLSGLIGRSVQLDPEGLGDWRVTPNLWGALVMRPSGLKSMQLGRALEPLQELENRARAEFEEGELDREIRLEALKAQEEQLKKDSRKKGGSLDVEALRELRAEARESAPTPRRYMVKDTTHEKLGELLRENPRGLTMVKDELGGWIEAMSREENAEARAFWLSSWNGDGSHDFDRIGRGTVRVDNLCVAVAGVIQPGPLQRFVQRSRAGGAGDVGFLQRFQLLIYPDGLPAWVRRARKVDAQARAQAFAVYAALDTLRESEEPVTLTFSAEAQPVFSEWRDALENRLRGGELAGYPAFESHLGKYRSLVPSLALVFHLVDVAAQGGGLQRLPPVGIDALELALNWAEYLELHARKIYALELGTSYAPAHELAGKIKEGAVKDGDKLRDLRRKEWSGLKDDALGLGIDALTRLGWVQVEEVETGGRPSEVLRLHPDLIGGQA